MGGEYQRWLHELDRRRHRNNRRKHTAIFGGTPRTKEYDPQALATSTMNFVREHFDGKDVSYFDEEEKAWRVEIPSDFSLISNPGPTIDALYSIVAVSKKKPRGLFIDHGSCTNMDLGASVVLDVLTLNLRQEWRQHKPYRLRGRFPRDRHTRNILQCMGITKHLQVASAAPPTDVDEKFLKFDLFHGQKSAEPSALGSSDQELASSKLAEYLSNCFSKAAGYKFSTEGKRHVVSLAGEVITNAEEHGQSSEWYAIAYMEPIDANAIDSDGKHPVLGECQLAIFNFGRSIYQSLSDQATPEATRQQITELVDKHSKKRLFDSQRYSKPDLWTLYALQDGVSRFSPEPGQLSRGKGTVRMISAFQSLGESHDANRNPEMALISGSTRIYFNKQYRLAKKAVSGGTREIIAFNESNSLEEKPDDQHVHSLTTPFPGTILTFRFYIDKRYLDHRLSKKNTTQVV